MTDSTSHSLEFVVTTIDDQERNQTKTFLIRATNAENKHMWIQAIGQRPGVKVVRISQIVWRKRE